MCGRFAIGEQGIAALVVCFLFWKRSRAESWLKVVYFGGGDGKEPGWITVLTDCALTKSSKTFSFPDRR